MLRELIDNNKKILEKRIKKETISRLINILATTKLDKKYVKILRSLINCYGKAVIGN